MPLFPRNTLQTTSNPSTRIRFELGRSGLVSLKVFDVLGRDVVELVNESLKPGTYEKTLDANGLASGVYFIEYYDPATAWQGTTGSITVAASGAGSHNVLFTDVECRWFEHKDGIGESYYQSLTEVEAPSLFNIEYW